MDYCKLNNERLHELIHAPNPQIALGAILKLAERHTNERLSQDEKYRKETAQAVRKRLIANGVITPVSPEKAKECREKRVRWMAKHYPKKIKHNERALTV